MRDIGHEVAPQAVLTPARLEQVDDAAGHGVEGRGEVVDLVAGGLGRDAAVIGREVTATQALHLAAQPPQARRHAPEQEQAGQQAEREAAGQGPEALTPEQALADIVGDLVIALPTQDDVEIGLGVVGVGDRRHGEDLALVGTARVVAEDRQAVAGEEGTNRREVDAAALDLVGIGRIGLDPARAVEQIDLDARVDGHIGRERGLECLAVQRPRDDETPLLDETPGQVEIEPLLDLLLIVPVHRQDRGRVEATDDEQQGEEPEREPGIERARHQPAPLKR